MSEDIRIERTKLALREAFCELLKTTPAYGISVTNLTNKAKVSRVTFYIHYKDMSDYIENVCDWLLSDIVWPPAAEMNVFNIDNARLIFTKQSESVMENAELFRALLGDNGPNYFWDRFSDVIESEYYVYLEKSKKEFSEQDVKDIVKYVSAGKLALMVDWITQEPMLPIEDMVEKIMKLTYRGVFTALGMMQDQESYQMEA